MYYTWAMSYLLSLASLLLHMCIKCSISKGIEKAIYKKVKAFLFVFHKICKCCQRFSKCLLGSKERLERFSFIKLVNLRIEEKIAPFALCMDEFSMGPYGVVLEVRVPSPYSQGHSHLWDLYTSNWQVLFYSNWSRYFEKQFDLIEFRTYCFELTGLNSMGVSAKGDWDDRYRETVYSQPFPLPTWNKTENPIWWWNY